MSPSRPFILRPVATTLLMIAIMLSGIVAYRFLPLAALPEVDYPTIQVQTFYPGASPDVMTSSVTAPLEVQLGQMPALNQMSSVSSAGASVITLQFGLTISLDVAEQEVQAAINAAGNLLPSDLPAPPIYAKVNPADAPILTLGLTSKTMPLTQVEDFVDTRLAQKISQLPGVGLVSISGGQRPAVRIRADIRKLAAYGLNIDDLRTTLGNANVNTPKGNFDGPMRAYTINANDQIRNASDYRSLIVAYKNGSPVRLSDVGDVIDGAQNDKLGAWMNETPAIILNIQRQPGANVIAVVEGIKSLLPQLQAALPAAIDVNILTDRTVTIRASVQDVEYELALAVILVVLVIFVFLRNTRATLIPSLSVPLSLVGTLGAMYLFGFSLNNLSLMALTIATGFVVDDAIVVLENVSRHIEEGMSPMKASLQWAREVGFTVLSMSISLIAVFIPILLMGGIVGRYFREFAVTLSVAILISLVLSLTMTPMMCSRLLRSEKGQRHGRLHALSERAFGAMHRGYERSLTWALDHGLVMIAILAAVVCLNIYLYIIIPKGFFPTQDTGRLTGFIQADQSISFQAMQPKLASFVAIVRADPAVENVVAFTGGSQRNTGQMFVQLKPLAERKDSADKIIARLRVKLADEPGANLFLNPVQDIRVGGRQANATYQYTLQADDLAELRTWEPRIRQALSQLPQLVDVNTDQQEKGLQTSLVIDRDAATRLGVSPKTIDTTLNDAFGQRQVSTIYSALNQYHVVMEAAPEYWQSPDSLDHVYVSNSQGASVPLSAFAHYAATNTSLGVNHQSQFVASTISFNLPEGTSLGQATLAIEDALARIGVPATVRGSFQGTARAFQDSLSSQPWLILAALLTVYIVLGILYESYVHPITILSTLPSAGVGALLALLLFQKEFSVIALIGVILLIGIVKKNAIMMIDFALEAERNRGRSSRDAIFEACLLRFRPIMMTTMAALLAAVPLALGTGDGAEFRQPLGISIVGGLIVSQMLTLFTTPVVYLYLDRFSLWARRRREGR